MTFTITVVANSDNCSRAEPNIAGSAYHHLRRTSSDATTDCFDKTEQQRRADMFDVTHGTLFCTTGGRCRRYLRQNHLPVLQFCHRLTTPRLLR